MHMARMCGKIVMKYCSGYHQQRSVRNNIIVAVQTTKFPVKILNEILMF